MTASPLSDDVTAMMKRLYVASVFCRDKGLTTSAGAIEDGARMLREQALALEQARLALAGVTAGTHVIVPREPTPNMIRAGSFSASDDGELENWRDRTRANAVAGYKAMLAAAPKQETLQTVLADALAASKGPT